MTPVYKITTALFGCAMLSAPLPALSQSDLDPQSESVVEACGENARACEEESRELLEQTEVGTDTPEDPGVEFEGGLSNNGSEGSASGSGNGATSGEEMQNMDLNGPAEGTPDTGSQSGSSTDTQSGDTAPSGTGGGTTSQ